MRPCNRPRTELSACYVPGHLIRCDVRHGPLPHLQNSAFTLSFLSSNNAESIIMAYCPQINHTIHNISTVGTNICNSISFCSNTMLMEYAPSESGENIFIIYLCKIKYSRFFNECAGWLKKGRIDTRKDRRYCVFVRIEGRSALLIYLRLLVNKTSKENLKPRKWSIPKVKFLQCNIQKSQHAQIDLNRRISKMNKNQERFICCIQEPCSTKSKLISQPNTVQRFGKTICPRTCIYTDSSMNAWFLEALSSKDITVIQVCILKQQVLIVSAYLDSSDGVVWNSEMERVIDYADNKNLGLIVCMDSNCHSTLFGPDSNPRGKKLEEAIAAHNLTVENIGHVPTFHGGN